MAATGTASKDVDLNRGASDQTLSPTKPQDPVDVGGKQEGSQETGVLNSERGVLPGDVRGGVPEAKAEMDRQGAVQNPARGVHFKDAPSSLVGNEGVAVNIGSGNDSSAKIEMAEGGATDGDTDMGEIGPGGASEDFKPGDESLMGEGFDSVGKESVVGDGGDEGVVVQAEVEKGGCALPRREERNSDTDDALTKPGLGQTPGSHACEAEGSVDGGVMDGSGWIETEHQANYSLPEENKDGFSVSDMVWGKVRNHPWWPGQIFDPSDSSELASKHKKKEGVLVAYFGDQTFGWCDVSQLKPFQKYFSQMEKQSPSETFLYAVNCAMDEVSRRVELGLTCSCVREEICAKIKFQKIANAGIRKGATTTSSADISLFEPGRLLDYIKELALLPLGGGERLELAIARAQVASFYRLKGYLDLPAFHVLAGLVENDADLSPGGKPLSPVSGEGKRTRRRGRPPHKQKRIPGDGLHPSRKHKSLAELMSGKKASNLASRKKGKAADSFSESSVQTRSKRRALLIDVDVKAPSPETSSMDGDGMSRVTGQLTRPLPNLEFSGESFQNNEIEVDSRRGKAVQISGSLQTPRDIQKQRGRIPKEYSSPDELLSQLCLAARDPMKGYSFISVIVRFFTDFRNSFHQKLSSSGKKLASEKTGRGRPSKKKVGSDESVELKNMEDSYWTDRIIVASTEEGQSDKGHKRKGESQLEIPKKKGRPASRQKPQPVSINPAMKRELIAEKQEGNEDSNDEGDCSPTALILSFGEAKSVPSEMDLSKIFSKYGPLNELEVLRKSNTAIVVFNRRSDAELAFNSAKKSSLFGPVLVSYQLRYLPMESKSTRSTLTLSEKDATPVEGNILMPSLQGKEDTRQTKGGFEVPGRVEIGEQRQF